MRNLDPDDVDTNYVLTGRLKRCPFCKGTPVTINRVNDDTGVFRGIVSCSRCGAQVGYNDRTREAAREGAVHLWECRAS